MGPSKRSVDPSENSQPAKKIKTTHSESNGSSENAFVDRLFDPASVARRHEEYMQSKPYKHSVFKALVDPALLQSVQNELVREITFTEKETDIYKVRLSFIL